MTTIMFAFPSCQTFCRKYYFCYTYILKSTANLGFLHAFPTVQGQNHKNISTESNFKVMAFLFAFQRQGKLKNSHLKIRQKFAFCVPLNDQQWSQDFMQEQHKGKWKKKEGTGLMKLDWSNATPHCLPGELLFILSSCWVSQGLFESSVWHRQLWILSR